VLELSVIEQSKFCIYLNAHLSQCQYIKDLLERYNHADCSPVGTPMDPGTKLTTEQAPSTPEEIEQMKTVPYIHAVGSLMYLAVAT